MRDVTFRKSFASAAATVLAGAALCLAAPGTAHAADPCRLGWSNVGPRTCAMTEVRTAPVAFLGDGVCVGMLNVAGTAFDGPLAEYTEAPGAAHAVVLRIGQGFSPLGTWAPTVLACDVHLVVDWHNLDHGNTGSVTHFVPAARTSSSPAIVLADTGPGRVQLTVRTDRPNLPQSTEIFVP